MDLISRQAAKNRKVYSDERHEYVVPVAEIDWLPSAQPEQQWTPCSERLPEEYDEYFVTWTCKESHKRYIGILEYEISGEYDHDKHQFKGEWLLDDYMDAYTDVRVIAWQLLPEPYKEGEEC